MSNSNNKSPGYRYCYPHYCLFFLYSMKGRKSKNINILPSSTGSCSRSEIKLSNIGTGRQQVSGQGYGIEIRVVVIVSLFIIYRIFWGYLGGHTGLVCRLTLNFTYEKKKLYKTCISYNGWGLISRSFIDGGLPI